VIEKTVRVVPLVRQSDDGRRTVIALFNASFDATGPVRLRLRSRPDRLVFSTGERALPIQVNRSGKETHIEIPTIAPWSTAILRSVG
jgi:uncharacterized protein (DUF3084 family)